LGFLNSPAAISIAAESGQTGAVILTENLDKMYARRLLAGNSGFEWYTNQDCGPQLDQLVQVVGTGGIPLNRPNNSINPSPLMPIKGLPRNEVEFAATCGSAGDVSLVDFGQMLSITKGGISQESSIHLEFLTDQLAVRFVYRFDARPRDASAITPFQGSNTQSPFLYLAAR
jgi:HK97 family phage major capsid protein